MVLFHNHVIAFKNRDKTDCRIENLILMSKAEMVVYAKTFIDWQILKPMRLAWLWLK